VHARCASRVEENVLVKFKGSDTAGAALSAALFICALCNRRGRGKLQTPW
jgi:hypothetical protein